jgi:EAL domain-containing protein (putative c-di-GMP-specific phosphodiesterase class I)
MALARFLSVLDGKVEAPASASGNVERILRAIRTHLGMDVAFASNVTPTHTVIRHADGATELPFRPGDAFPVEEGYCKRVLDGRLPALIHDAGQEPEVADLACTREMSIGAHVSVPLRLSDGSVYGTFCCFSHRPDHSLNQRDVDMMRAFADLAAGHIEQDWIDSARRTETAERISRALTRDGFTTVYQPIFGLAAGDLIGLECLARFPGGDGRGPDRWFAEAVEVGLGVDLEIAALRAGLRVLAHVPQGVYLAINVSPETLLSGRVEPLLQGIARGRIVLEVTEHAIVEDSALLQRALRPLRDRVRIAIDDAGAGYSGLRQILDIRPDIIKLDMSLTRGIDADSARAALASALITFAREIGGSIVAEGIETAAELATLRRLGADAGQGYYLERPRPIAALAPLLLVRGLEGGCAPEAMAASG